jgi:hypothetical protein
VSGGLGIIFSTLAQIVFARVDDESPSYDTIVATQRDQFVDDIHIRRLLIFGDNIAKIADMTLIILRSSVLFLQTKNYHQTVPIIPRTFVGLKCPPAATQPSPQIPFLVNVEAVFSRREPVDGALDLNPFVGLGESHPSVDGVCFEDHHGLLHLERASVGTI